jgi:hypothetical protein
LKDGFMGGNRLWMALGAAGWLIKAFQWAAQRQPEVVYHAELAPGETLILSRETPQAAKERVKRRSRRR